jgi:predicted O-methyltransferase YrrM
MAIEGQLNEAERRLITEAITGAAKKPLVAIEVGTWLGGGSTLHILRALEQNGTGHLWGVEAFKDIYEKMIANIRLGAPEAVERFTPLFGFSTQVLPAWLQTLPPGKDIDFVFLDGGDNPREQIEEFDLLADRIRLGGILMAHDARTRKGKWFVPYLSLLDNWRTEVFDLSPYGIVRSCKIKAQPSDASRQAARRKFQRLQLEPKELVARLLPSRINGMILNALPKRLKRKLTIGAD